MVATSGSHDHFPYQCAIFLIVQTPRYIVQLLSVNLYGGKSEPSYNHIS